MGNSLYLKYRVDSITSFPFIPVSLSLNYTLIKKQMKSKWLCMSTTFLNISQVEFGPILQLQQKHGTVMAYNCKIFRK
jgi:hypothetical protein